MRKALHFPAHDCSLSVLGRVAFAWCPQMAQPVRLAAGQSSRCHFWPNLFQDLETSGQRIEQNESCCVELLRFDSRAASGYQEAYLGADRDDGLEASDAPGLQFALAPANDSPRTSARRAKMLSLSHARSD